MAMQTKEHNRYIFNENCRREIKLTYIPEDKKIMVTSGTSHGFTAGMKPTFVCHYKFKCKTEKQGWFMWYNINNISDCDKFEDLDILSDVKKKKSAYRISC